jgi:DNA invertase Pin-like site-specific DNA recombinase
MCEMGDEMTVLGYARVSTDGQTLEGQQAALTAAGATKIFAEKISGAISDRKALGKAIAALGAGDVLLVTRPSKHVGGHN